MIYPDIDIDVQPPFTPSNIFDVTIASNILSNEVKKHPVGVYFQNIPSINKLSAIPYKEAEECGFIKIDFLHLNMLSYFQTKDEIREILKIEPQWSKLLDEDFVSKLFQISKHYNIVSAIAPNSIQELADCIALIRPNKIKLLTKYIKNREKTRIELYKKQSNSDYRKSHAIAYAHVIVLQMNLLTNNIYL